jgi:hypothetical protein
LLTQYKEKGGKIPKVGIDTVINHLTSGNNSDAGNSSNVNNSKMNYSVDNIKSQPINPVSQKSNISKPSAPSSETDYEDARL